MSRESGYSVVVAVQLDAVPVNRRCFVQRVHHHDADRLATLEEDRRTWQQWAGGWRRARALMQYVAKGRFGHRPAGVDGGDEAQSPTCRWLLRRLYDAAIAHLHAHDEP